MRVANILKILLFGLMLISLVSFVVGAQTRTALDMILLETYNLNDIVMISVPLTFNDYSITISDGVNVYKLIGSTEHEIPFIPQYEGIYTVELVSNAELGSLFYDSFSVGNIIPSTTQVQTTPEPTLPFNMQNSLLPQTITDTILNPLNDITFVPYIKDSKNNLIDADISIDGGQRLSSIGSVNAKEFAGKLDLIPRQGNVKKISFENINLTKGFNLNVEDLPNEKIIIKNIEFDSKNSFAIDPSKIDFTKATLTFIPQGSELFKCKDWNFQAQSCFGSWQKIADTIPGEEYNLTIYPFDPAFTSGDSKSLVNYANMTDNLDDTNKDVTTELRALNSGTNCTINNTEGYVTLATLQMSWNNTEDIKSIQNASVTLNWRRVTNNQVGATTANFSWYNKTSGNFIPITGCQGVTVTIGTGYVNYTCNINSSLVNVSNAKNLTIIVIFGTALSGGAGQRSVTYVDYAFYSLDYTLYDRTPPIIQNVSTLNLYPFNTSIKWDTDDSSNSSVNYGLTTSLGTIVSNTSYSIINHTVFISGLTANTPYYYNVTSCNIDNYCNTSGPYSFTTPILQSQVNLLINGSSANFSINESHYANLTGIKIIGEGQIYLYIDGVLINQGYGNISNITQFVIPGSYNITTKYLATQNYSESSKSWFLLVNDTINPNVSLIYPNPNGFDYDGAISFEYSVNDTNTIKNCSLYINGTLNDTSFTIQKEVSQYFTKNFVSGVYNWSVRCYDNSNRFTISESRILNIDTSGFPVNDTPYSAILDNSTDVTSLVNSTGGGSAFISGFSSTNPRYMTLNWSFNLPLGATVSSSTFYINHNETSSSKMTMTISFFNGTGYETLCNLPNRVTLTEDQCALGTRIKNYTDSKNISIRVDYSSSTGNAIDASIDLAYLVIRYSNDTTKPAIVLNSPSNGAYRGVGTILFQYTPSDLNIISNCTLWSDFSGVFQNESVNYSISNGVINNFSAYLTEGFYKWNVLCFDIAGNSAFANINYTLNITNPDFEILESYINFSNNLPIQNENITLFVTIKNRGNVDALVPFTARFYLNDPDLGGTQIGGDITINSLLTNENITINTTYIIPSGGPKNIFAVVDPPTSTNGSIKETDESNNKANKTFNVRSWQTIYGNINGFFLLADNINKTVMSWNTNSPGGKIFVAETGRQIGFANLQAFGRKTDNTTSSNDYYELDQKLNSTGFFDSVNITFNNRVYKNITIFGKNIKNIPFVNSTNTSNFQTGMLWDSSDGGTEFNGTQDALFFTELNPNKPGKYGVYSFELIVPVNLKDYLDTNYFTLSYYYEIE